MRPDCTVANALVDAPLNATNCTKRRQNVENMARIACQIVNQANTRDALMSN
jgi:hypothetical protein